MPSQNRPQWERLTYAATGFVLAVVAVFGVKKLLLQDVGNEPTSAMIFSLEIVLFGALLSAFVLREIAGVYSLVVLTRRGADANFHLEFRDVAVLLLAFGGSLGVYIAVVQALHLK